MNSRKRLIVTVPAQRDLQSIFSHIAKETTQSSAASNQLTRIMMHADMLRDFPYSGRDRSAMRDGLRSCREGRYTVFYHVGLEAIAILRVLHESQDADAIIRRTLDK